MGALIDLTGKRFDRLEVVQRAGTLYKYNARGHVLRTEPTWLCRCDCNKEVVVRGVNLREKRTRSCGCYSMEVHTAILRAINKREDGHIDHESAAATERGPEARIHQ